MPTVKVGYRSIWEDCLQFYAATASRNASNRDDRTAVESTAVPCTSIVEFKFKNINHKSNCCTDFICKKIFPRHAGTRFQRATEIFKYFVLLIYSFVHIAVIYIFPSFQHLNDKNLSLVWVEVS